MDATTAEAMDRSIDSLNNVYVVGSSILLLSERVCADPDPKSVARDRPDPKSVARDPGSRPPECRPPETRGVDPQIPKSVARGSRPPDSEIGSPGEETLRFPKPRLRRRVM